MNRALFLGLTTVDILYGVSSHPGPNTKQKAQWQRSFAGGPAANAAVAFSALGNESQLCSGLGNHPLAQLAVEDLREHDVVLADCAAQKSSTPVLSSILVNGVTGDRCVIYTNTDGRYLDGKVNYCSMLDGCNLLMLDGYYLAQAVPLAREAKRIGLITVLDGGSWKKGLDQLLPSIDYAICSENFQPPGCEDSQALFQYLSGFNIAGCGVSRGSRPVIVYSGGTTSYFEVPRVEEVDSLGAGDIMHGAFCHYILSHPFEESLEHAALIASESCRYPGPRQWIKHAHCSRDQGR